MPYDYSKERERLWNDKGQRALLAVRDLVDDFLDYSGAFMIQKVYMETVLTAQPSPRDGLHHFNNLDADEYMIYACVDRLLELREIQEVAQPDCQAVEHRLFVRSGVHSVQ